MLSGSIVSITELVYKGVTLEDQRSKPQGCGGAEAGEISTLVPQLRTLTTEQAHRRLEAVWWLKVGPQTFSIPKILLKIPRRATIATGLYKDAHKHKQEDPDLPSLIARSP